MPSGAVDLYSYVFKCVTGVEAPEPATTDFLEDLMGQAGWDALPDDQKKSAIWLYGAIQVNSSHGAFSLVIRQYNVRQGQLRGKGTFDEDQLQEASNAVGLNLASTILDPTDNLGRPNENQGRLPTVQDIGVNDLLGVRDKLYPGNESEGSELFLNQAWPGIVMLGALGGQYTDRLLRYQEDGAHPVALDQLGDLKSLLFCWDSFRSAFQTTWDQTLSVTTMSDALIGMNLTPTVIANALEALAQYGFTSFAQTVFSALVQPQNDKAREALNVIAQLGSQKFLDMVMGARTGELLVGTTTEDGFVSDASAFFNSFSSEELQSLRAMLLGDADSIATLAKTDASVRAALAALSVVSVQVSDDVAEKFTLYDEATGEGQITDQWIEDRSRVLAAFRVYWERGETDGVLSVTDGSLLNVPFAQLGDTQIVVEGATAATTQQLVVDGFDSVLTPTMLRYFGNDEANSRTGGAADDHLFGGGGNDTLAGLGDADYLEGNDGNDKLDGGAGADTLLGGTGSDTLNGGVGDDQLSGGLGDDRYEIDDDSGFDVITSSDVGDKLVLAGRELDGTGEMQARTENTVVWIDESDALQVITYMYDKEAQTLTVAGAGSTVQVRAFEDGDLGISVPGGAMPVEQLPPWTEGNDYGAADAAAGDVWVHGDANGLAGNDAMIGLWQDTRASVDQTLDGGAGNDIVLGNAGDDDIRGGAGNDLLNGGVGGDTLLGGDGDDLIYGAVNWYGLSLTHSQWEQDATWSWSWGNGSAASANHLYYDSSSGELTIDWELRGQGDEPLDMQVYLPSTEQGDGSDGDTVFAGAGNDLVIGSYGDNFLSGDEGDDYLGAHEGQDTLLGGTGSDVLLARDGDDLLDGGTGNDTMYGQGGVDSLVGGDDDDVMWGDGERISDTAAETHGADYLDAGAGNDVAHGGGGDDILYGGEGADALEGDGGEAPVAYAGADWLDGGEGADTVAGGARDDVLYGGADADLLLGDQADGEVADGDGSDELNGEDGDDVLVGTGGGDWLDGGDGADVLLGDAGTGTENAADGADVLDGGNGDDALAGQGDDDWLFGGGGDDQLQGGSGNDYLDGDAGSDAILGGSGDDTLVAEGADYLDGGEGDDTYIIDGVQTRDVNGEEVISVGYVDDAGGTNELVVQAAWDTSIDVFSFAGQQYVQLGGTGGALVALGSKAALSGLQVHQADGTLANLQGAVDASSAHGLVKSAEWSLAGGVVDTATISTDQALQGSARPEWLAGGSGDDSLAADAGNDWVSAGAGADMLEGGAGTDTLEGGTGGDTIKDDGLQSDVFLFSRGDGSDTVAYTRWTSTGEARDVIRFGQGITADDIQAFNLKAVQRDGSFQLLLVYGDGDEIVLDVGDEANISRLEFADGSSMSITQVVAMARAAEGDGSGADADTGTVLGTAADDLLTGDDGFDNIRGLQGDDTLDGGGGYDVLSGGAGTNVYRFSAASGSDRIEAASDEIGILQFADADMAGLTAWVDGADLVVATQAEQTVRLAGFADEAHARRYDDWLVEAGGQSISLAELAAAASNPPAPDGGEQVAEFVDAAMLSLSNYAQTEFIGSDGGRYWITPAVSVQSKSGSSLTLDHFLTLGVGFTESTRSYLSPVYRTVTVTHSATVEDAGTWVQPINAGYSAGGGGDGGGTGTEYWVTTSSHVQTWETTEQYVVGWSRTTETFSSFTADANARFVQVTGTGGADSFVSAGIGSSSPALFRGTIDSGDGDDLIRLATGHLSPDIGVMDRTDDWAALQSQNELLQLDVESYPVYSPLGPVLGPDDAGGPSTLGRPHHERVDGWDADTRVMPFRDHGTGAWIDAGAGNDTIAGSDADDVIIGGTGSDWMDGQAGADTYRVGRDGAVDHIADIATLRPEDLVGLESWNQEHYHELLLGYDNDGVPFYGPDLRVPIRNEDVVEFDSTVAQAQLSYAWAPSTEGVGYRTLKLFADGTEFLQIEYGTDDSNAGVEKFKFAGGSELTLDELLSSIPLMQALSLEGSADDDVLVGGAGADTLSGHEGNDLVDGGLGDDTYIYRTGDGRDTVHEAGGADVLRLIDVANLNGVAARPATNPGSNGIFVALLDQSGNETTNGVWVPVDATGHSVIETVVFSDGSTAAFGDLLITEQTWTGTGSPDTWTGDRRDDIASGGLGGDTMHGGTGNDALSGDTGNDKLFGDGGHDQLYGGLGTDTLRGGAGNDTLDGGTSGDTMAGDEGDDTYFVDNTQDSVSENAGEGWDTVLASISYTLLANQETLTLTGASDLTGTGNALANRLTGNSGANLLTGYAGDDVLQGGAGNDTMVGGSGGDTYLFGAGSGNDGILDTDATVSVKDRVQFDSGIAASDVSFTKQGSDLLVRVNGLSDTLLIANWYLDSKYHVEQFAFADGTVLTDGQVGQQFSAATDSAIARRHALGVDADGGWIGIQGRLLVQAMAGFKGDQGGLCVDTSSHGLEWRSWDALTMPTAIA